MATKLKYGRQANNDSMSAQAQSELSSGCDSIRGGNSCWEEVENRSVYCRRFCFAVETAAENRVCRSSI